MARHNNAIGTTQRVSPDLTLTFCHINFLLLVLIISLSKYVFPGGKFLRGAFFFFSNNVFWSHKILPHWISMPDGWEWGRE